MLPHDHDSSNNERSGILIFCFESLSRVCQIKKLSKRLVDGHLGGLRPDHAKNQPDSIVLSPSSRGTTSVILIAETKQKLVTTSINV